MSLTMTYRHTFKFLIQKDFVYTQATTIKFETDIFTFTIYEDICWFWCTYLFFIWSDLRQTFIFAFRIGPWHLLILPWPALFSSYSNAIWNIHFGFAEFTLIVYFDRGLLFYFTFLHYWIWNVHSSFLSNLYQTLSRLLFFLHCSIDDWHVVGSFFEYTHHLFEFDITHARSKLIDIKPAMILRILRW